MTKIFDYDGELVSFTEEGAKVAIQAYDLTKQGLSVEEIEETLDLKRNHDSEAPHIEYRIIMAVGKLSGLHDQFDAVEAVYSIMDEVELTGEVI